MQNRRSSDAFRSRPRQRYRRPRFEHLGQRTMFAVFVVTTAEDVVDESDGFISLREALTLANEERGLDTIEFDPVLFVEGPAVIEITSGQFDITDSVELKGPGATLFVIDARHLSRAFEISDSATDVKISGMTITRGATFGDDGYLVNENDGPAVLARNSGITELIDVVISENKTQGSYAHGAVSAVAGSLIVRDSIFENNTTTGYRSFGAAIYVHVINARIENSILRNNASLGPEGGGGAIMAEYGTIDAFDSTFTDNVAGGYAAFGGAMYASVATITRSLIRGNRTEGPYGRGGGLSVGMLTLVDSQVRENETRGYGANGGGIAGVSTSLIRSLVTQNKTISPDSVGGGIAFDGYISAGSLMIDDTSIIDNVSNRNPEVWFSSNYSPDFDIDVKLVGKQLLEFSDAKQWRMGLPLERSGNFLLTASHVDSVMSRLIIETSHPYTNPLSPSDINNDGSVTALDALLIINELARRNRITGQDYLLGKPTLENWRGHYHDQNQDGQITALDALRVINAISRAIRGPIKEQMVEWLSNPFKEVDVNLREQPKGLPVLVGLTMSTGRYGVGFAYEAVSSLQPIYRESNGDIISGKRIGPELANVRTLLSPMGQAISAVRYERISDRIVGIQLQFSNIQNGVLDLETSYWSEMYLREGETSSTIGDGRPFVGIGGRQSKQELREIELAVLSEA